MPQVRTSTGADADEKRCRVSAEHVGLQPATVTDDLEPTWWCIELLEDLPLDVWAVLAELGRVNGSAYVLDTWAVKHVVAD